jgi:hypothetical protein
VARRQQHHRWDNSTARGSSSVCDDAATDENDICAFVIKGQVTSEFYCFRGAYSGKLELAAGVKNPRHDKLTVPEFDTTTQRNSKTVDDEGTFLFALFFQNRMSVSTSEI